MAKGGRAALIDFGASRIRNLQGARHQSAEKRIVLPLRKVRSRQKKRIVDRRGSVREQVSPARSHADRQM